MLCFPLPDRERFVAEVNFEKARDDPSARGEFHVAVRDEAEAENDWLVEAKPPMECHLWNRDGSVFERAVDAVYGELVLHEIVSDQERTLWSPWPTAGNSHGLRPLRRQRIECLPATTGAEKESAE